MRTQPNRIGQLGNTGLRPFSLRSIGRQLRDAPSDGHRSSFAFPGLRRFHRLWFANESVRIVDCPEAWRGLKSRRYKTCHIRKFE